MRLINGIARSDAAHCCLVTVVVHGYVAILIFSVSVLSRWLAGNYFIYYYHLIPRVVRTAIRPETPVNRVPQFCWKGRSQRTHQRS